MSHSFFRQFDADAISFAEFLTYCADIQADGVEVSAHHLPPGVEDHFIEIIERSGLTLSALDLTCDLVFADEADVLSFAETLFPWVDRLSRSTDSVLMLSPGGYKPGISADSIRSSMAIGLNRIIEYAEGSSVTVAIENHGGLASLRGKVSHMEEFSEKSPRLGFTFDIGNFLLAAEDPLAAYRALRSRIVHVHAKDYEISDSRDDSKPHLFHPGGGSYRPSPIGGGVAPTGEILDLLRESGYDGCVSVEYEGDEPAPERAVASSVVYLRRLLIDRQGARTRYDT